MTNCEYCGHPAVLEGDGIYEEQGWVCTAHCNQDRHDCPYDGVTLKVSGAGELTCDKCDRVFDENLNVLRGKKRLSGRELFRVFQACVDEQDCDPFFNWDGFTMLASIVEIIKDHGHRGDFKRKDVRIQWRHEPFEGMELLGKTAQWVDAYSTVEGENANCS